MYIKPTENFTGLATAFGKMNIPFIGRIGSVKRVEKRPERIVGMSRRNNRSIRSGGCAMDFRKKNCTTTGGYDSVEIFVRKISTSEINRTINKKTCFGVNGEFAGKNRRIRNVRDRTYVQFYRKSIFGKSKNIVFIKRTLII